MEYNKQKKKKRKREKKKGERIKRQKETHIDTNNF